LTIVESQVANLFVDYNVKLSSNPPMQTLGLSNSTMRSESRLKSLFWPSIQTSSDVDYLGAQGYWVCAVIAALSFIFLVISGHAIVAAIVLFFYYLSGVGVREHSRYAAGAVLIMYATETVAAGPVGGSVAVRVLVVALLLSNFRATWIASHWRPDSEDAIVTPRFGETRGDKFTDKLPMWLWPKIRIPYYVFSACYMALIVFGLTVMMLRRT
jgi:hypothetical protein